MSKIRQTMLFELEMTQMKTINEGRGKGKGRQMKIGSKRPDIHLVKPVFKVH